MRDYLRSALFVDFDNVFIELNKIDRNLAARFARNPAGWVRHLERHHLPEGATQRRVLVRRCYLNPDAFGQFRSSFVAAAFETVDCPPLTFNNKTSADMHIALDMVDALHGMTHFDEFVVMSADADFVPVLMRLRRHDRRTAIFASGKAAAAFTSAADIVITRDAFRDFVAERVADAGEGATDPAPAGKIVEALAAPGDDTDIPDADPDADPGADSGVDSGADPDRGAGAGAGGETIGEFSGGAIATLPDGGDGALLGRVAEALADIVAARPGAIDLASLAHALRDAVPELDPDWGGHERLGTLLRRVELGGLVYVSDSPGYLYDPIRQAPPTTGSNRPNGHVDGVDAELQELIGRIGDVTGVPRLAPERYAALFGHIAAGIGTDGDAGSARFVKAVRDACTADGTPVSRQAVTFVLTGLERSDRDFASGTRSADDLAATFRGAVELLCRRTGLELSATDRTLLRRWIGGGGRTAGSVGGELGEGVGDEPGGEAGNHIEDGIGDETGGEAGDVVVRDEAETGGDVSDERRLAP